MSSRLLVESGRMRIFGPTGLTPFDTDDGLFHVIDKISGTQNIPSFNFTTGADTNATDSTLLGTCHADCTDVIGSVKFTLGSQAAGMAYDRWHSVMGGSILWLIDGQTSAASSNLNICQLVIYDFRVDSGNVYLDRRRYCSQNMSVSYTVLSHSITYKLKAGLYT